ncbi:UDP-N-acetylmuramoylalanine--D-glutamate ligase MurD [Planctomycetes bacterium Pan216]|uniref:UDP-N-acetylmuramoylalanine--D-glutamate ligase n=1 Tax=Kolteria novifilia TaxID=2527975 RepID=A0A518BAF8_9BACT|nr:UDP-N-acetylmuramoylalanine--D-glutamate ligase MurD [Planctomycetes bacterium Pan216]
MKNWLIIGAGVSGKAAALYLRARGHGVRISEKRWLEPAERDGLVDVGVDVRDAGHDVNHLDAIDAVVVSPGVATNHFLVRSALQRGLAIVPEIELALDEVRGPLLAVTGTNGKSTTCAMIAHLLEGLGQRPILAGNFGIPLSHFLIDGPTHAPVVLEVSSYQLEFCDRLRSRSAAVLNLDADHLRRHVTLDNYLASKWKLLEQCESGGTVILPAELDDRAARLRLMPPRARKLTVGIGSSDADVVLHQRQVRERGGSQLADLGVLPWSEPHNDYNAMVAMLLTASIVPESLSVLAHLLRDFRGLPHRCQPIGELRHRPVIDDSKATNVAATLAAVMSFEEPVTLLVGGEPKGDAWEALLEARGTIDHVVAFGEAAPLIERTLCGRVEVTCYASLRDCLEDAERWARREGGPILFSPGCSSFDEFADFEDRGRFFQRWLSSRQDAGGREVVANGASPFGR